jgi:hypothetical protein
MRRFTALAIAAACWLLVAGTASAAPTTPPFTECPPIGLDTGCAILIVLNDNGVQILTDPAQGPYDGVEDTLIGVLDNTTGTTITSVPLSGSSAVFGFDGDGICSPNNPTQPFSPGPPDANAAVGPCTDNGKDTSIGGYGGANSYFTNINGAQTSGTVNFITALGPGQTTYFSLEGNITASDINIVSGTSVPISAVEGASFTGTVANFSSTNTSTLASQYTASIDWGDGGSSTGTVAGGSGSFTVSGTHTYAEEGSYTATITITDTSSGNTTSVQSPVTVADAALTAGTLTATGGVEGSTASSASFAFTDANAGATTADFTATCDWGDGSTNSGTVTGSAGSFSVDCGSSHTYAEEGSSTVTVSVSDDGGSTTSGSTSVTVADAPLTSVCAAMAVSPQAFGGSTATFTDADVNGIVTDYSASIDWGDGSSSAGSISGGPGTGPYTVTGSHTYLSTGPFTIKTKIDDAGGSTTTATCQTLVFAFAPGRGGFVVGDGNSAVGTAVTFWSSQWQKANSLSGGAAPAAFKGYALNPATPACRTSWSTDPGNSAPPPSGPLPAYMGVIVSSSITQSGSQISGDTPHIVVVKTNPGYGPAPGHAGTGTVVAQFC